jgi:Arc/MetJ-type ribon-helix-helix transcriptional regulator
MADVLPSDVEDFVRKELDRGEFDSREQLVSTALRLFQHLRSRHEALREEIRHAIDQADRGEAVEIDIDAVIAEGHARVARRMGA